MFLILYLIELQFVYWRYLAIVLLIYSGILTKDIEDIRVIVLNSWLIYLISIFDWVILEAMLLKAVFTWCHILDPQS